MLPLVLKLTIEVDVKVKFPENYGPDEISGKDAVFHCKIHEVKQKVLPELDEEFIKDLNIPGVKDLEQLKAKFPELIYWTETSEGTMYKYGEELAFIIKNGRLVSESMFVEGNGSITEEELEFELSKMAEQYNMTIDQIKNALGQQLGQFRHNLIMQKIENFLFENNK